MNRAPFLDFNEVLVTGGTGSFGHAVIRTLIERHEFREVVVLKYVECLSVDDIAGILDLPEGTVKTHLFRARKELAAALTAAGAEPARVSSALYERRTGEALRWLGESLSRIQVSADGRVAWLALPAGLVPEAFIESEELVNYPRSIATVKVACLLRELGGGRVKVSLRAKGEVDVNRIAARFGGGGHANAAGCTLTGSLAGATREVLEAVQAAVAAGR